MKQNPLPKHCFNHSTPPRTSADKFSTTETTTTKQISHNASYALKKPIKWLKLPVTSPPPPVTTTITATYPLTCAARQPPLWLTWSKSIKVHRRPDEYDTTTRELTSLSLSDHSLVLLSLSLRCSLRCCRQALNDDDKGRWWLCKHSGSCAVVLFDADLFTLKKSLFDIYLLCQADRIVKNKVVLVQMSNLHSPEFDLLAHSHLGANSLNKTQRDCHIFCQKRTQMFSDNFLTNPIVWVYEHQSRKRVRGKT